MYHPFLEQWKGSSWSVSCGCYAGYWSIVSTPNYPGATAGFFSSVSCSSAASCVVIGSATNSGGFFFLRLQDGTWTILPHTLVADDDGYTSEIVCASSTTCILDGGFENSAKPGARKHGGWSGRLSRHSRRPCRPTRGADTALTGVACASATDCAFDGTLSSDSAPPVELSYDNAKWSYLSYTKGADPVAITAQPTSSDANLVASGSDGTLPWTAIKSASGSQRAMSAKTPQPRCSWVTK